MSNIIKEIEKEKLIVIVRGVESEKLLSLTQAMCDGGVRFLEITYDQSGKVSAETTAENIRKLSTAFKGRVHIGAGTVLNEKQVGLTAEAGGEFIISPDINESVVRKTKEYGMVSIPGAFTPTEITTAKRAGADFVKIFPAGAIGAAYIKAIKSPLSGIKLMAVGGIDDKNAKEYFAAGACGVGIGAYIVDKKLVQKEDWQGIKELAERYVKTIKEV